MLRSPLFRIAVLFVVAACGVASVGCDNKEPVVDVETPAGSVDVDRDVDTGEVEVNVTDKE